MYRVPSSRKRRGNTEAKLNLIPILDAIFIFIFFLLSSTSLIQLFEVGTTKPVVSSKTPPSKKKPLGLTIKIGNTFISVYTGVPQVLRKSFGKLGNGEYDFEGLHEYAIQLKKNYMHEDSAILEPLIDIKYEQLIKIMDSIRTLKNTDESLYKTDKDGINEKVENLFDKIVFGNLTS